MTRDEFYDSVDSMSELYVVACDGGLENYFDGYYSEDDFNDYMCDRLREDIDAVGWRDAVSYANEAPWGYDYYYVSDNGDIWGVDRDAFEELRDQIADRLEEDGFFEEELVEVAEPESENTPFEEPDDRPEDISEDFDLLSLYDSAVQVVHTAVSEQRRMEAEREREEAEAFNMLFF